MTILCDYCTKPATLVTGNVIYPHRMDLAHLFFWQCKSCRAYVGCHKKNCGYGDGTKPLGRLANSELRAWKSRAHDAFDGTWRNGQMSRHTAYTRLATSLKISPANCHIGMFDVGMCKTVVEIYLTNKLEAS